MTATWWDSPEQGVNDTPVVRHAPDDGQYHVPDYRQLDLMRGSPVGRFAIVPSARRDGASTGFDHNVAGPVHVDPDAPDGGVIFDPSQVSKQAVTQAVSSSYYPHQAFYKLGTPAPLLGYGKGGRRSFYDSRPQDEDPRVNSRLPPNAYIAPKALEDGRQAEAAYVGDGRGEGPSGYNPVYRAQEEQRVNPAPPLTSLGPPPAANGPVPTQQAQPVQPGPYQQPYAQPQQPYYPPYPVAPPPTDPNLVAMMQQLAHGLTAMNQRMGAIEQSQRQPPTTGVSPNPMPVGPPPGLASVPAEMRQRGGGRRQQYNPAQEENFDDETARPIARQVHRDKRTGTIVEEEEAEAPPRPPRRSRRNPNSLVEYDQDERQQTVEDYERLQEEDNPRRGVIAGFETLNVPWLTGPVANKAKRTVFFEIPNAGKHSARYHDVIESEHCVVLVYDTRYEDGTQYLPPDMGDSKLKLHVPDRKKTYTVSSMGFSYSFGVFDQIVLVKHEVEALDYEER